MVALGELILGAEPDAVPTARRFVGSSLGGRWQSVSSDAELIATELVTNAWLHGAPPVSVRVFEEEDCLRIEVEDHGREVPVRIRQDPESMTGRGLTLVSALASNWGIDSSDSGGKVIWVELRDEPSPSYRSTEELDVDALLAEWEDDLSDLRYEVRLGSVPTALLLSAKAHIDNVVRELTLMRGQEASGGQGLAAPMARLVETVTQDFAEARAAIKRQALAAADAGQAFTDLVLELPLSAADAGERYLAALDQADRHARSARLLTVAPPRSHRAFRRWYVGAVVEGLRAASRGLRAPEPEPFPLLLAAEMDRLDALEETWHRLQILQKLTADLTDAVSVVDVATRAVEDAAAYSGVKTARVFMLSEGRRLRSLAHQGEIRHASRYDDVGLDEDLPAAVVARSGRALFLRSLAHINEQFPDLEGYYAGERSLHVMPLVVGERVLGVLTLTFVSDELDDESQVAFVKALADTLAQALERAQAIEGAERERQRELHLLNAQLEALSGIVAGQSLAPALSALLRAFEQVAPEPMFASVSLVDDDGTHLIHGAAPSLPDFYNQAVDGMEISPRSASCGTAAFLRQAVVVEDILDDRRWDNYREVAVRAGLRAAWSTPILAGNGRLLGTFATYYLRPRRPDDIDLGLIQVLVKVVALAIERSRIDQERLRQLATERAVALTLQHSLMPAVPAEIGPIRLRAAYRAGDPGVEVGGDWFDAVAVDDGVVLLVGDVQGHDLAAAALMGQLRTVGRAAAGEGRSPSGVLESMNRYLERSDSELLATALVAHLNVTTDEIVVASAGHLSPIVLAPDQQAWAASELEDVPGPPLGVGNEWSDRRRVVPAGSILLLYTDGLVESRTWPLQDGIDLLLHTLAGLSVDIELNDVLEAALDLLPTGSRGDDVAVLAASVPSRQISRARRAGRAGR